MMLLRAWNLLLFEECFLVFTNIAVITINKYVLSVLHFTIPTVFQGWQTLVCVLLLTALMKWKKFRVDVQWLENRMLLRLVFPLICFSLGNVAGSKALAELPVSIYLAATNLMPAFLALLCKNAQPLTSFKSIGSVAIISSILALYVEHAGHETGWLWLLIHVGSLLAYNLAIVNFRLSSSTVIFYSNFSSVLILLPLSIYLQEATHALNHARNANIEFFIGCVLSGVLGTGLQLLTGNLQEKPYISIHQGVAKILACSVSLIFFTNDIDPLCWLLIVVNLVMGCFVFVPEHQDVEKLVDITAV